MTEVDYLIVGAGLTGAVVARMLWDAGSRVLVIDRRTDVGGNVHDTVHESGIRVHTYGPHYFRTNNEPIWDFVNRFADFHPYGAIVGSVVDGRVEDWPVTEDYIRREVGPDWEPAHTGDVNNFEEASLAMMPRVVYERFVKGYSEKQWGVPARALDAGLAGRFEVRIGSDRRLKTHRHQGIPVEGYAQFMERMLEGIPRVLGVDYLAHRDRFAAHRHLVFTGPIDEYFEFDLGRLAYRGQRRRHEYHAGPPRLPMGQVNDPRPDRDHIRTLEWVHMMPPEEAAAVNGTLLTTETPFSPSEPDQFEYPFPNDANRSLYEQYRKRLSTMSAVTICGRLGEYRYYDMDQAIGRAMRIARRLTS